jgi:hypothetical protein
MSKRSLQVAAGVVLVLVAAQLIRPDRSNPATDVSHTIRAHAGITSELAAVLDRSCGDCHSNQTLWPWYASVAPFSWLMTYGVNKGRKAVNFSEWVRYSPKQQEKLLVESCQDVKSGKMPGLYSVLHPEITLSSRDVDTICAAARPAEAPSARISP